jgi:hypothetical protein
MPLHFQHGFGDQAAENHHRVQIPFGKNRLRLGGTPSGFNTISIRSWLSERRNLR